MTVRILPPDNNAQGPSSCDARIPLGSNPCLPLIISGTFGWEAVSIETEDIKGETLRLGACRKGQKIVMLPHFSYGPASPSEAVSGVIRELKMQGYRCEWRTLSEDSSSCLKNKATTLLHLSADTGSQLAGLNSGVRYKIKKSKRNGITVVRGRTELLNDFYSVYSRRMHELGSPSLPKRWYNDLLRLYNNGDVSVWCAYLGKKAIGAAFVLEYQGFYEACWFATLSKYNRLYTSYGLIWEMVCYAISRSGKIFSLGRSTTGSSVHRYKKQWGGEDVGLCWNYSHQPRLSVRNLRFISQCWKLIPYPLARLIGPWFASRVY